MQEPLIPTTEGRRSTLAITANRQFTVPAEEPNPFLSNKISTAKYNWLTFLPKNLWEQFHKISNVYFLVIAIL